MENNNKSSKDKNTALLLALFLGAWTYLYTYKKDKVKFWLAVGLAIPTIGISGIVFWIMAIVETVNRDKSFYENIDNIDVSNNQSNVDALFLTEDKILNIKINKCISDIRYYRENPIIYLILIFIVSIPISFGFGLITQEISGSNNDAYGFSGMFIFISIIIIGLRKFWNEKNDKSKKILNNRLDELEGYNSKVFSELGGKEKVLDYL